MAHTPIVANGTEAIESTTATQLSSHRADAAKVKYRLLVLAGLGAMLITGDLLLPPPIVLNPYYLTLLGLTTWWFGWRKALVLAAVTVAFLVVHEYFRAPTTAALVNVASWTFTRIAMVVIVARLGNAYRANQQMAHTDGLTGLANRRHFDIVASEELTRAQRYQHPLTVAVLDVNAFKSFNDTYGHVAGDNVLRRIGTEIRSRLRSTDTIARIGGDEFAIIFPETTESQAHAALAELTQRLAEIYPSGVSVGVNQFQTNSASVHDLLEKSDKAMYRAKRTSRSIG